MQDYGSGNNATALRIKKYLKFYFEIITLENSNNFQTYDQIKQKTNEDFDLVICVHAYHSGRLFYQQDSITLPPIITIFGGTDVHSSNPDWLNIIRNTICLSSFLICFSEDLMLTAAKVYPKCEKKCIIIPQGVDVHPKNDFKLIDHIKFDTKNSKIISWVGSIRNVKDPLYIESLLNDIYLIDNTICFVYAGYSLDEALVNSLKQLQIKNRNFYYINGLNESEAHGLINCSWAFINTSINEGMSLAILEAMKLKIPVCVRKNIGNCSIIKHKFNGLIFDSKNEFIENILYLLQDFHLRQKLISNAFYYINETHSVEVETNSYYNCILNAINQK